jgi:hypothetical protein
MQELLNICATLLDNADLDISVEIFTSKVTLDFIVGGSLEKIIIYCKNYQRLRITKSHDEEQCFFVGKTEIESVYSKSKLQELLKEDGWLYHDKTEFTPMFRVKCEGAITLDIICSRLEWQIDGSQSKVVPIPDLVE